MLTLAALGLATLRALSVVKVRECTFFGSIEGLTQFLAKAQAQ